MLTEDARKRRLGRMMALAKVDRGWTGTQLAAALGRMKLGGQRVERFEVGERDLCGVRGQRRVDEHQRHADTSGACQPIQQQQQFLRAP